MQQSDGENANNTNLKLTAVTAIAVGFFQNNHVNVSDIPNVLASIGTAVDGFLNIATPASAPAEEARKEPFLPIKRSVTPDAIISLFDGSRFKSLKRHLRTTHNMSPEQYRVYWGLPHDYPMVAPNYAKARSELAKSMGLGQGGRQAAKTATAPKASTKRAAKKTPEAPAQAEAQNEGGAEA
jgi:predicted transcriptional regulator